MLRKSCSSARSLLECMPWNAVGAFVRQSMPCESTVRKLSRRQGLSIGTATEPDELRADERIEDLLSAPFFLATICRIIFVIHRLISVNGIMSSTVYFEQGGDSSKDALIARLRRFVEDSDLTFYQIASRVGTTGTILSMWLSGAAKPSANDLLQIECLLKG